MNEQLKTKPALLVSVPMTPDVATLRPHPIAADFPMMGVSDLESLKASIRGGYHDDEPITLYGSPPMILDGRNRLAAGRAVGHRFTSKNFQLFTGSVEEAEAFSNAKNFARRHLTGEQKSALIKTYITLHPDLSSREIGRKLNVSHVTVEKYKKEEDASKTELRKVIAAFEKLSDDQKAKFFQACSE